MVELVDAPDSKSGSVRSVGSIPTARTIFARFSLALSDHARRLDPSHLDHVTSDIGHPVHDRDFQDAVARPAFS